MESHSPSRSFHLLHPKVQRWVWEHRWTELRDAQERAVEPILSGRTDLIIAAPTASGKTEAAFLPICSSLAGADIPSFYALYISPLKALINDQFERLGQLCEHLDIPVHRWHGDVAGSKKKKVVREPRGLLLITPESLEALFVIHGTEIARLFSHLSYVVVDELHSFIGSERGAQLRSHLHRIECVVKKRIPRIGLSATIGDMAIAAEFLRPGGAGLVNLILCENCGQEVMLQLRGYRHEALPMRPEEAGDHAAAGQTDEDAKETGDEMDIAAHLLSTLRGSHNLIFANRRAQVERFADLLRRLSEERRVPNEFFAHHGSLSKGIREEAEALLKTRERPTTAVCTTTLEMGIDIGAVKSIAQIGCPPSVASLRQRLGRSGRRGEPAVLRIYITEKALTAQSHVLDLLRTELVQAIAMVRLLIARWCEPPSGDALHLSTLIQQVLSLIAQYGGVRAEQAHAVLSKFGPFSNVDAAGFASLLREIARRDLIVQERDGTLLLGMKGERIVNHYSFFSAFNAPEEFRIESDKGLLGSLPISRPLAEGEFLIFAGRRWIVASVDLERRTIYVSSARGGRLPAFLWGTGPMVHDRVRQEMKTVYMSADVPPFLDALARDLLAEARANFSRMDLGKRCIVKDGRDTLLFPWMGDRIVNTLHLFCKVAGLSTENLGVAISAEKIAPEAFVEALKSVAAAGLPDGPSLAKVITNKITEKYDGFLGEDLLCADYASRGLDVPGAREAMERALAAACES